MAVEERVYFWDQQLPGFGLRVSPARAGRGGPPRRVWVFRYRAPGSRRQREVKLAAYPVMDFPTAREEAMGLALAVAKGIDPQRTQTSRTTVRELCELFERVRFPVLSPKTARGYASMMRNHVLAPRYGIAELDVADVGKDDLQALLNAISEQLNRKGTRKVGQAKKAHGFLRTLFNFAIDEGLRPVGSSPIRGVRVDARRRDWELDKIEPVGHIFEAEETPRVWEALDEANIHEAAADALRLIALTGVRSDEARLLCWRDVVLDGPYPHLAVRRHKTDVRHPIKDVPLSTSAVEILRRRRPGLPGAYVFPSPVDASKPVGDLWTPWTRVRELAGVPRARVHDLRGLAACQLAAAGWSEAQIQVFMGWDSQEMVRNYVAASQGIKREGARILELGVRAGQ